METGTPEKPADVLPPDIRSPEEAADLKLLLAKPENPQYTVIEFAADVELFWKKYPCTKEALADKLGRSRPWVSELLAFLSLPDDIKVRALKERLGYKELQSLLAAKRAAEKPQPSANASANAANGPANGADGAANGANGAANAAKAPANDANGVIEAANAPDFDENNEPSDANAPANADQPDLGRSKVFPGVSGYPFVRKAINIFLATAMPWVDDHRLGHVAEELLIKIRDAGWPIITLRSIYLGLAICGLWFVTHEGWEKFHRKVVYWFRPATITSATGAANTSLQTPQMTGRLIAGNRMELRWTPGPIGTRYQVYWNSADGKMKENVGGPVQTPGAIVEVAYVDIHLRGHLTVIAIAPDNTPSAPSAPVPYDPTPLNRFNTAQALPVEGNSAMGNEGKRQSAMRGGRPPLPIAPAVSVPIAPSPLSPPIELHADVRTPDLIYLSWRPVSKTATYNVYSSASSDLSNLRKENDVPIKTGRVEWVPETGKPRYWVVVTTRGEGDQESAYSEAIEVIRRPDKSGADFTDGAANVIKKVLPW